MRASLSKIKSCRKISKWMTQTCRRRKHRCSVSPHHRKRLKQRVPPRTWTPPRRNSEITHSPQMNTNSPFEHPRIECGVLSRCAPASHGWQQATPSNHPPRYDLQQKSGKSEVPEKGCDLRGRRGEVTVDAPSASVGAQSDCYRSQMMETEKKRDSLRFLMKYL